MAKVLVTAQTYHPSIGGGVRYRKAVTDHLRDRGHEVDVLTINTQRKRKVETAPGGRIIRAPLWFSFQSTRFSPGLIAEFQRICGGYDVVLFNFPSPMCELAELLVGSDYPRRVTMYHADIVPAKRFANLYNRLVTRPFLARMDAVIVASPGTARTSPHLRAVQSKIEVIPFGIDSSPFDSTGNARTERDQLKLLFVGRLARYKGVDHLLRALTDAPGDLRIVGEGEEGQRLEALASSLGLRSRVEFVGRVDDDQLHREYAEADVLILPSTDRGEAFGYVLVEAMMAGCALVSTELGTGTSFVNQHEKTGFVLPPGDPQALREALRRFHQDRALLGKLKLAAGRRAREFFSISRMLAETEKVLFPQ